MAKQLVFEDMTSNSGIATFERVKVHGGWLVLTIVNVLTTNDNVGVMQEGYEWNTNTTFVSDPDHQWLPPEENE